MFEIVSRWLDQLPDNASLIFVTVPPASSGSDWTNVMAGVLGTLLGSFVGAGATLYAARASYKKGEEAERARRNTEAKQLGAMRALAAHHKLSEWINLICQIDKYVTDCLKRAGLDPASRPISYHFVSPPGGKFIEPERLKIEEYSFLMSKVNYKALDQIKLVEQRAIYLHELFIKYGDLRVEIDQWMDTIPGYTREWDANNITATNKIPKGYTQQYEFKGRQLDTLIDGIMRNMAEEIDISIKAINEFAEIAFVEFSPYFPKLKMEV